MSIYDTPLHIIETRVTDPIIFALRDLLVRWGNNDPTPTHCLLKAVRWAVLFGLANRNALLDAFGPDHQSDALEGINVVSDPPSPQTARVSALMTCPEGRLPTRRQIESFLGDIGRTLRFKSVYVDTVEDDRRVYYIHGRDLQLRIRSTGSFLQVAFHVPMRLYRLRMQGVPVQEEEGIGVFRDFKSRSGGGARGGIGTSLATIEQRIARLEAQLLLS